MDNEDKCHDVPANESAPARSRSTGLGVPSQEADREPEVELQAYLDLLKELPPTPSYDNPRDELRHIPEGSKDSGWQKCLNAVEKYDRELCQTYREQIDTLLVFAGLFSAVVTAFAVESYQWLQDDPADTSVELLRDMVALLSQNLNVTSPPTLVSPSRLSGPAITRINCFWFLSLSLSLSAALVGILCKQWLREYEHSVGQSPQRALAVRHIRFLGLEYWKVGSIVMSVPIIMQMALAFFMIGIIELLWRLHVVVACCVTVVAGLTLAFFLATTFLPLFQYAYICIRCCINPLRYWRYSARQAFTEPQCAYKSPQAWLVFRLIQPVLERLLKTYGHHFSYRRPPHDAELELRSANSWVTFDINWINRREHIHFGPRCAFLSLAWIARNIGDLQLSSGIWHCVWGRWLKTKNSLSTMAQASMDIDPVACSHLPVVRPSYDLPPYIRAQALVFRCSLRADLPIDTAVELLLRVAPTVGVGSTWTAEAVHAIVVVYDHLSIHLSDGLAIGLFRLAERQTHAILVQPAGPNPAAQVNAALAFRDILVIIYQFSRLRNSLMAAMSGLALQWLRADPPAETALVARRVLEIMIVHLSGYGHHGDALTLFPGVILPARLAGAVAAFWPEFVRENYLVDRPHQAAVMRELLALLSTPYSDGAHENPVGAPSPLSVHSQHAGVECLDAPARETNMDPGVNEGQGGLSPQTVPAHLSIDVHGDGEEDSVGMDIGVNRPASPASSRTPPE